MSTVAEKKNAATTSATITLEALNNINNLNGQSAAIRAHRVLVDADLQGTRQEINCRNAVEYLQAGRVAQATVELRAAYRRIFSDMAPQHGTMVDQVLTKAATLQLELENGALGTDEHAFEKVLLFTNYIARMDVGLDVRVSAASYAACIAHAIKNHAQGYEGNVVRFIRLTAALLATEK